MPASNANPAQIAAELDAEVVSLARRGASGGLYYLAGWLVIHAYGDTFARHWATAAAILCAFVALAVARYALARRLGADAPETGRRRVAQWWGLILATTVLWSAASAWCYFDPHFERVRVVTLMCTMTYVTALTYTFSMRWRPALIGIVLLIVPSLAWTYTLADNGAAIVLSFYTAYLVDALRTSYQEQRYQRRLRRELAEQRDRYAGLAHTDALTRLPNRRVFTWTLEQTFASESTASLLVVDLDHFKRINDEHGHAAGDACLVAFAQILREAVGGYDAVVARIGGEEFGVVLSGMCLEEAHALASDIRRHLHESAGDPSLRGITVSIGVGECRLEYRRPEEWFVEVDRALYRAKAAGRDRVCCT